MRKKHIAVFASGTGSNAVRLIDHFMDDPSASVVLVISNREDAPVLSKAKDRGVETLVMENSEISAGEKLLESCRSRSIDLIALAGFLRKIPDVLVAAYADRIINVHPSLLPKFGGPGMYGDHVHRAVLGAGEKETGITIHFVNEHFDEGQKIASFHCPVVPEDTLETLRERVQRLEHTWFPVVIEKTLSSL
jgi:phosphoribosylglycinamide formyltransferase-1